ncbi:UDP-3-O-acyl-N-acetylglucosamine deacetylase [uncultured Fibrobacter sp.]|uniref:UDP-3-O-acyl-N-acetylglucosamine deacetylase n=1 Tax=uncultured Fibrobacter sp. TaxID=261512 RepID=UPI002630F9E3|nr:UDP-3-O-acyl-N-acetylglucosamine deacetylase [uncultured Fibrobacter sp.]
MSNELVFKSRSLSFRQASVSVEPLERDPQKIPFVAWFVGEKLFYRSDACHCFEELEFFAKRTAGYKLKDSAGSTAGESSLHLLSPEHLAPVFLMWPHRRFNVRLTDATKPEVPLMDGSAIPFFCEIRKFCGAPEELAFYDAPVHAEWDLHAVGMSLRGAEGDAAIHGHVRITPAETFEVEYVLDRNTARDGYDLKSAASVSIYSPENLYQIFMARTFIHQVELERACAAGLLAGVDESCGLLLAAGDCAAQNSACSPKFRIANEPAMHKILDLIGDLSFICPALPRVRIEITNGGHVSHRQIMEKIIPYVHAGIFTQV